MLLASALKAIELKKDIVDESDIPEPQKKQEELVQDEKTILDILKETHSMQAGELYKTYCGKTKFAKAERTFRNYMRSLCEKNLLKAIGTNKGRVYELVE